MAEAPLQTAAPKLPKLAQAAIRVQVWMQLHGLMGSLAAEIMVITVTGRKTGRQYSTPIGYLRDGETIIALSRGSNWYKNAVATGRAQIEIRQQKIAVRAEAVTDQAERERIFALCQRERQEFSAAIRRAGECTRSRIETGVSVREFMKMTPVK